MRTNIQFNVDLEINKKIFNPLDLWHDEMMYGIEDFVTEDTVTSLIKAYKSLPSMVNIADIVLMYNRVFENSGDVDIDLIIESVEIDRDFIYIKFTNGFDLNIRIANKGDFNIYMA